MSSVPTMTRGCCTSTSASARHSARVYAAPVGLQGELISSRRVFGVMAASSWRGVSLVTLRGRAVRRHRQAVGQQHHVRVAHPVRRRDDGFITRIEHGHAEVVDSLLGARAHENLVALVGDLIVALELRDDGVLQLDDAVDVRVTREALADRLDAGFGDVRGRIEVRLAGAQADDVLALGFQFRGARGDCESGRGLDALNASASWMGTGEPFFVEETEEGLGWSNGRVYYAIRFNSPRLTERLKSWKTSLLY